MKLERIELPLIAKVASINAAPGSARGAEIREEESTEKICILIKKEGEEQIRRMFYILLPTDSFPLMSTKFIANLSGYMVLEQL